MVSGDLAAGAVADALAAGVAAPTAYRARWGSEIGAELEESVALQRFLFADGARIDALVDGARGTSPIVGAVTRWATGTSRYADLRRSVVMRNPALGIVLGAILMKKRLEATRRPVFQSEHP